MENVVDCIKYSTEIREKIFFFIKMLKIQPHIAILMVGNDPASEIYVRNKVKVAKTLNIVADVIRFDEKVSKDELHKKIRCLNEDKKIDGIIVQLPLPLHISKDNLLLEIDPTKDLDGLNPFNIGLLHSLKEVPYTIDKIFDVLNDVNKKEFFKNIGKTIPFIPCTPLGCLHIIDRVLQLKKESIVGKKVIIFGNSNLVSKPMARLLLQSGATVTTLHSRSKDYEYIMKKADIIISATGKEQKVINDKNINTNTILIDIGIRPGENGITGDLDFKSLSKTNIITPVPKGIGPMTISSLMLNALIASLNKS